MGQDIEAEDITVFSKLVRVQSSIIEDRIKCCLLLSIFSLFSILPFVQLDGSSPGGSLSVDVLALSNQISHHVFIDLFLAHDFFRTKIYFFGR